LPPGPELPDWVDARELDPAVRSALRGLDPRNVEKVAGHLVAAGNLVDDDPVAALAHARAARDRASRVAVVREAVGVAAYHAEDYAEAARELRAYRRMSGDEGYRAVLADCERALGRPEVALRLVAEALADGPDAEETTELRLVEAGARRDLGEAAAARLVLEAALGGRPDPAALDASEPGLLRIASAYADLLADQGEESRATEWLTAIAAADPEDLTGAVERLGIEFTELDEDEDEDEDDDDDVAPEVAAPVVETEPVMAELRDDEDDLSDEEVELGAEPDAPGFAAEVEAEVAELLGEIEPPDGAPAQEEPRDDAEH
jgi:tetratricopeptide (TPR) repeat protein